MNTHAIPAILASSLKTINLSARRTYNKLQPRDVAASYDIPQPSKIKMAILNRNKMISILASFRLAGRCSSALQQRHERCWLRAKFMIRNRKIMAKFNVIAMKLLPKKWFSKPG